MYLFKSNFDILLYLQEGRPDSKEIRKTEKDTTRPDTNLKSDTKPSTLSLS